MLHWELPLLPEFLATGRHTCLKGVWMDPTERSWTWQHKINKKLTVPLGLGNSRGPVRRVRWWQWKILQVRDCRCIQGCWSVADWRKRLWQEESAWSTHGNHSSSLNGSLVFPLFQPWLQPSRWRGVRELYGKTESSRPGPFSPWAPWTSPLPGAKQETQQLWPRGLQRDLTECFSSPWRGPHRHKVHILWGKWFLLTHFWIFFSSYNVLHVDDIAKRSVST